MRTVAVRLGKSYRDFFNLTRAKRYLILYGGTRAGKTYAILQYLFLYALRHTQQRISVVSLSFPHLRRGALRDFEDMLKSLALPHDYHKTIHAFIFPSGSFIEFFSVDQSAKVRGAQRDILFINEANLIDFDSFSELDVRTKKQILLDFNPTGRFWLNEFYETHSMRDWFAWGRFTYRDNAFLSREQIEVIEARRADERWWRVYGEGEWGEAAGRAWYRFDVVEVLPVDARLVGVGVDYGFTQSPTAAVEVWRLGDDYYVREVLYQYAISIHELVAFLREYRSKTKIIADSAEKDLNFKLRQEYNIPVLPSRKYDLRSSFATLNAKNVKIVLPSSNLLKEAYSLQWEGDRLLGDKHAIDALRYAMMI